MPAAIAVPAIATAVAGGTAAGATIVASHKASNASKRASTIQGRADAEAMAFEREREAEAKRQWDIEQANQTEQRNYDRRLMDEREARMAPYRATSAAALGKLGTMLGIQVPQMAEAGGGGAAPMGGAAMPQPIGAGGITEMYHRGPVDPMALPNTLGAQLQLRSRRPIDPLVRT